MLEHEYPRSDEDEFFDDDFVRAKAEAWAESETIGEGDTGEGDDLLFDGYPRVPRELKARDQWVNWQQDEGRKIPLNPRTLRNAGVGYENTWSTYPFAVAVAAREQLGIGFVLTEQDPYTCIDLDKVIEGRDLKPYAREILDAMTGYVELSPSGTGLHVWVKSREAFNRRTQGIEVYSDHRWMTVTGRANPRVPTEIPDRTEQVKQLIDERFPKPEPTVFAPPKRVEEDDAALWQRLFSTKNGNFLQALYDGDLSVVKDDHSRGVIMLANMLAVYTHCDVARMESLLAQTKLVNDKWHEKRGKLTWIEFQIQDAINFVHEREAARRGREEKRTEGNTATKEASSAPAAERKDNGIVARKTANANKSKPGRNHRRGAAAKNDTAAPAEKEEKKQTRNPRGRTS